ncbi:MAG: UDP-glucose/GDP-mannose dehydrogenase family protein [Pleurocapsa sp. MO_226.B13]|nr:UDP-glucose/GDP-mannose dehydrogenase family protein [Pleurocapsa sp. MO_226.B13]
MKISIFGLGYVGVVTAACLSRDGHQVVGVDISQNKVDLINQGKSPIIEPDLEELLEQGVRSGRIHATTDAETAVKTTEISLISVGTPPIAQGEPDLSYVINVCKDIALAVKKKATSHVVMLRSTVPPGTLEHCQNIMERVVGKSLINTAFNPEFLREGSAIKDYDYPPYTIIGTESSIAEQAVRQLYETVKAPILVVKPTVAEMVKYVANTWHATKVSFANEIGRISKAFGVDGREVMNVIVQDEKLNISPIYMRPGFAYGGSCLPKDLGALLYYARSKNVFAPLINAVPITNELQINLAVQKILDAGVRNIAILGLAFKANTDDLRESPTVPLIKRLLGEGCKVKIYDSAVYQAHLMGTNLSYIQENIPHFQELLIATPQQVLEGTDLAVATHNTEEIRQALEQAYHKTKILDLAGVFTEKPKDWEYEGLAW